MPRTAYRDLPAALRAAVCERTGRVLEESPTRYGARSALTSALSTESGLFFVKAAPADGQYAKGLRNEAAVNPYMKHLAAPLLWQIEAEGWLLLGFEHVAGRHEVYAPGSASLDSLTRLLHELADLPCPDVVTGSVARTWAGDGHELAEAMSGGSLLHTDLNPANLLLCESGRAVLTDWAWVSRGAAWVEIALVLPRLIGHGHTAAQAEEWAAQFPAWRTAPPHALDAFAARNLRRWEEAAARGGDAAAWPTAMREATRQWHGHRLRQAGGRPPKTTCPSE